MDRVIVEAEARPSRRQYWLWSTSELKIILPGVESQQNRLVITISGCNFEHSVGRYRGQCCALAAAYATPFKYKSA
ncbi:hypothetical protein TNCV_4055991 [Trichonephila clavipes]|nr:hypothetical protein TNCV_4055991 [Trichonephila clavipes]